MTENRSGAAPRQVLRGRRNPVTAVLPVLIVVNQTVGVACQFVQHTDPRFPLAYFTVDSAVLAGVIALLALLVGQFRGAWQLRLAAAVGVCVSAVVFAAVIAPATQTGTWFQPHDDWFMRTANLLLHGTAPVLVVADYVARAEATSVRRSVSWAYVWPLTYLAGLLAVAAVFGGDTIPYPFLRPSVVGWPTATGAVIALIALVAVVSAMLSVLCRVVIRTRARGESSV
ncbi:MAG: Pr6Pr family membrane protein [Actinobacteria bacterium]|nr:Pr6Pr family membrane protein [Actinomycetota bacterium]